MYKASIDLGRISPHLKVTFNLVMKGDNKAQASKYLSETVDKFTFNGSTYLRFNPKPFITLDISKAGDKGEGWNPNMTVNLNKMSLFEFNQACESIIEAFRVKELFYTKDNKLKINREVAKNFVQHLRAGNKAVLITHAVVVDDENIDIEYEGVSLMINSIDNFALITYSEFKYLLHLLSTINMDTLAMQLINAYIAIEKKSDSQKSRELALPPLTVNEPEQSECDIKPLPKTEDGHELPDI